MKTKLIFHLLTALSLLLAALKVQAVHAAPVTSAASAAMLQVTAGGHALGLAADGMHAAMGSHSLHVNFVETNHIQPRSDTPASKQGQASALNQITYADLWDGITLDNPAVAGNVYTTIYTVSPVANPAVIRLGYNAPFTLNDNGTLSITFEASTLTESAPLA